MILRIYALYDKDAETLNERTFNAPNEKVAKRILKETLKNDHTLANNASHYELHDCGQYDTESGITANGKSVVICSLESLLSMAEPATPAPSAE